ncbi:MAG: hypothetical protein GF411_11825 [Candidatus Lokiarchaeota archaeon]|nr:hypothetical protein [Candidatus Lokiarchaeota archaeon]
MTIEYRLVNAVWSGNLRKRIDLDEIAASFPSRATFEVEKFPGMRWKDKDDKNSLLVFASGKFIVNLYVEIEKVESVLQDFIKYYNSLYFIRRESHLSMPDVELQNLVATGKIEKSLNLELLSLELENTVYEPEQYPGMVWRIRRYNVTVILFGSGGFTITGAESESIIRQTLELIEEVGGFLMTYERNKQYKADLLPVIEQHLSLIRESGLFDDHPDGLDYKTLSRCVHEILKSHNFGVRVFPSLANSSAMLVYECILRHTSIKFRPPKNRITEILDSSLSKKVLANHFRMPHRLLFSEIPPLRDDDDDSPRELIIAIKDSLDELTEFKMSDYLSEVECLALRINSLVPENDFQSTILACACMYLAHRYRIGKELLHLPQKILLAFFRYHSGISKEVRFIEEKVDIMSLRSLGHEAFNCG